jgi:putative hydrolase of the HAD superfamily
MKRALLFDLDDTLMVEESAAVAAFEAAARFAAARRDIEAAPLAVTARSRARELWYAAPTHPYCLRVGISSWEGLWCRFEGDEPSARRLREWSATYRREAWRLALAEQGVEDPGLAEELGERFVIERRMRHQVFGDAVPVLTELSDFYALALVTNGASCLQREKLAASGLGRHFAVVVVSADLGIGKPDAAIFRHALSQLGCDSAGAVMVGDSLSRDVDGAIAAGLAAVWVNRFSRARRGGRCDVVEVATLRDLPAVLSELAPAADVKA